MHANNNVINKDDGELLDSKAQGLLTIPSNFSPHLVVDESRKFQIHTFEAV